MKIHFSKKEYRTLLELLHLGDWILHSHEITEKPATAQHRELLRKLFSHYKAMACEDLIEQHNGDDNLYETRAFEDAMQAHIENYNEQFFWEELASRLAIRDMEAGLTDQQVASMDDKERISRICDAEEKWFDEINRHGLLRLGVTDHDRDQKG